ncbi:MAG: hypothetical protein K0U98_06840 [Deltaproteobacteria bacterium]|nr:hypothetical protein [Deltaproteobacteria bacterium]
MSSLALGESLEFQGAISRHQLERALVRQRRHGGRLGTCLLEIQAISERRLLAAVSRGLAVPAVEVETLLKTPPSVRALISSSTATRQRVIPFELENSRLKVAFLDPTDLAARDEIAFATGKRIEVFVALESRIYEALEKFYGGECPKRMARLLDQLNRARYLWRDSESGNRKTELPERPPENSQPRPQRPSPNLLESATVAKRALQPQPGRFSSDLQQSAGLSSLDTKNGDQGSMPLATALQSSSGPAIAPTENELAELYSDQALVNPDSFPLPTLDSRLKNARSAQEIGSAVLDFLEADFDRVALFSPQGSGFKGWMIGGVAPNRPRFEQFLDSLEEASLFSTGDADGKIFVGRLERSAAHRRLVDCWQGDWPMECLFLPIRVGDRVLCFIYADRSAEKTRPRPRSEWKTLVSKTAKAFESCILRNREQSSSKVESV